ncbi:MAG: hypothetical protein OEW87_05610, partial [Flavobacteriaceae bacterium]|nr:hypothetical protein [Flavobacteriaceae bacterium]
MGKITPRRSFLGKSLIATAGLVFISSSSTLKAFTGNDSPYMGYNPFTEEKTDLRTTVFGKHISVKGAIYDKTGSIPLPNAKVEVWHLSPNSTKFRHRAKLKTDSTGEYQFITDFPNKEKGKTPRIFFKITTDDQSYFTELLITSSDAHITGKHWEENRQLGDKLFPIKETYLDQS